jgi:hypothetical protein
MRNNCAQGGCKEKGGARLDASANLGSIDELGKI